MQNVCYPLDFQVKCDVIVASVVHLMFRCSTESNSGSPRHTFAMGKEEHTEVPPSLLMDDLGLTTAGLSISFFSMCKG